MNAPSKTLMFLTDKQSINKSVQLINWKKLVWLNTNEFKVILLKLIESRLLNKIELLNDEEYSSKNMIFLKVIY